MSKNDREILVTIVQAYEHMTDFDRGYFLGVAETRLKDKKENEDPTPPVKAG